MSFFKNLTSKLKKIMSEDTKLVDQAFLDANPLFAKQGLAVGDPLPTQEVIDQVSQVAADAEKVEDEKIRRYKLLQPEIADGVEVEAGAVLRMTRVYAAENFQSETIQELVEGAAEQTASGPATAGTNPAAPAALTPAAPVVPASETVSAEIPVDPEHPFKVIKDGKFVRAFDSAIDAQQHASNIGAGWQDHTNGVPQEA